MTILREVWEATSFELQKLQQVSRECVEAEQRGLKSRKSLNWTLTYDPAEVKLSKFKEPSFQLQTYQVNSSFSQTLTPTFLLLLK